MNLLTISNYLFVILTIGLFPKFEGQSAITTDSEFRKYDNIVRTEFSGVLKNTTRLGNNDENQLYSITNNSTDIIKTGTPVNVHIDLTKVTKDRVPVTIDPGRIRSKNITYRLPRVIQGTYSISNFGKFIENFRAFDYKGNELSVSKIDVNSWTISNAKKLDSITYFVNDTFDIEKISEFNVPRSPEGTNIEAQNYLLNLHGFVGYFDSALETEYNLTVTAPASFKHSSALQIVSSHSNSDHTKITNSYTATRYFDITDNPMMYGNLEIEEFIIGEINVVLSVYSKNKIHTAKEIRETVIEMMEAQMAYLGDIESTSRYDIFVYLADDHESSPAGFGALEHHTSTVVVLPEYWAKEYLAEVIFDLVSHEFFHIVTPLNVHSEDVHYFDYDQPTFSKHLWMYEGITEYFSRLFQIDQNLITEEEFYNILSKKLLESRRFDDAMSFTQMSEHILESKYGSNYPNVYQKGTLIAMCIDILIREESQGEKSLLSLMKELSTIYGKDNPFSDDTIIDEITARTYPQVGDFLRRHVEGTLPIPYQVYFDKVGIDLNNDELKPIEEPTANQLRLKKAWLNRKAENTIFIDNVNVIPMDKEVILKNQTVIIKNGKILKIEPYSNILGFESNIHIDATGKYLIPGLSEMHYHWRDNKRNIENDFKLLIANGITTARNMAEYDGQDHVSIRSKINNGQLPGPNYYTTGPYLQGTQLQSVEDAARVVKKHKDKAYDFLKIGDGREISREIYLKLLEEAAKYEIDVIGHAQHNLPLEYSLRMKSIEHVEEFIYIFNTPDNYSFLNNDINFLNSAAQQIKDSGIYIAPTLVIFEMITQYLDESRFSILQKSDEAKYLTAKEAAYWLSDENHYRADFPSGKKIGEMDALNFFKSYFSWMKNFTRILSDHNIPLLSGSDTFGMVVPGFSLHKEFEILQEVGLTPFEILKSSTVTPARYLNTIALEGTISEGKNANLILLNNNPLEDIRNTKKIEGVMLKGVWLDRDKLDIMLKDVELSGD